MTSLKLVKNDPWLEPFKEVINRRLEKTKSKINDFTKSESSLTKSVNAHIYYGLHKNNKNWIFREWAPNANSIYLIGEFSNWKPLEKYKLNKLDNGNWEISILEKEISHGMLYKILINWGDDSKERIPAYARRVVQDEKTNVFSAQVWEPETKYKWKHNSKIKIDNPLIYEAHIGMATDELRVGTYDEFRENVLPRIAYLGYNTIQLMAIQEHPYY